ncbi:hypothetical protein ACV3NL_04085 [Clostridium perfringens]|nr:hypothetical protein [Clostridium perfringens]MDK0602575.1 hypothetical protein [Clostridium perfringens]
MITRLEQLKIINRQKLFEELKSIKDVNVRLKKAILARENLDIVQTILLFTDDENIKRYRLGRERLLYENRKNVLLKELYDDWPKEMLEKF